MKILLVKPDHLGDFALTLPVLWELAGRFGKENIDVLVYPPNVEWGTLLPWLPPLHPVFHPIFARGSSGTLDESFVAADALAARGIDHGFELSANRHDGLGKMWLVLAKAKQRTGLSGQWDFLLSHPLPGRRTHETRRMAELFPAEWGITGESDPALFMPPALRHPGRGKGQGIVLVPYSGKPIKEWTDAAWAVLVAEIGRRWPEEPVSLLAGPERVEEGWALAARAGLSSEAVFVPGTIGRALEKLAASRAVVSVDTGAAHFASLTGTPLVEIFSGATGIDRWIARTAEREATALYNPVPCSPCRHEVCPVPGRPCMEAILPEEVAALLAQVLGA
ncbi:ADP-heptose:LPS heptosyltransferase [Verrucomicrobium sp. GAS474]|uniref:glycosyltransferase family 9 protein n=1 Tax=Verrucomicrobium sp. GAS474 TaxID=1882831 RepID=UPI00087A8E79|nr:glycosyltransferase family 9 protein [Verrucomicrobium sp. GAS474]SDU04671.1 ADP-heptose:LPS heptosyltransferase [Verrucomicrobium sp. GAS474]